MQRNHIRLPEQRVPVNILGNLPARFGFMCIIGQDLHAKCLGDPAGSLTDPAKPDDADCLVCQFDQRIIPEAPVNAVCPAAFMNFI